LHEALLAELHAAGPLDWSRAAVDSSHVRTMKGGPKPARARLTAPGLARSTTWRGRPRQQPDRLYADRAYDHDKYRRQVRDKGITPVIARRGTGHGSGLGVHRWVVEQSLALLHWFRRLRIRWEIRDDIHEAFLSLACAIICWRRLRNF
jgi:hypothetical protein